MMAITFLSDLSETHDLGERSIPRHGAKRLIRAGLTIIAPYSLSIIWNPRSCAKRPRKGSTSTANIYTSTMCPVLPNRLYSSTTENWERKREQTTKGMVRVRSDITRHVSERLRTFNTLVRLLLQSRLEQVSRRVNSMLAATLVAHVEIALRANTRHSSGRRMKLTGGYPAERGKPRRSPLGGSTRRTIPSYDLVCAHLFR